MKIAIIGAGPSGLCAAKEIRQANPDAEIMLFEQAGELGGGFATSYEGLTLVNNPMLINFSDFLAEETLDELRMWSAAEYVSYLQRYATHFNLHPLIHYNSKVLQTRREENQWQVTVACNNETLSYSADYLVVCAGSNHHAHQPELPLNNFEGRVLHASQVKNPNDFADQHVLIIGLGETGSDLTHFIAQKAAAVNISIRRWPGFLIPRYHDQRPTDLDTSMLYHRLPFRIDSSRLAWMLKLKRWLEKRKIENSLDRKIQECADQLNNRYPETQPLGPFRRMSTKSCGFIRSLLENQVTIRGALQHVEGRQAFFTDGTMCPVDTIICCTGYRLSFPFLPEDLLPEGTSSNRFYHHMFPIEAHHYLAFIGYIRPAVGSVPPLAELQSRILAGYLSGTLTLPGTQHMRQQVEQQQQATQKQFPVDYQRITHIVDYFSYMKGLALQLGVMPRQRLLLRQDPALWFKVNCAFICPAVFRLHGPDSTYTASSRTLKRLPTMPASVVLLELTTNAICWGLSALGMKKFRAK